MIKQRNLWLAAVPFLVLALAVFSVFGSAALAQSGDESPETLMEQATALAAEQNPAPPAAPSGNVPQVTYPLLAGVDDAAIGGWEIDPVTNAFLNSFPGFQVWGMAYDAANQFIYTNNGSTLYRWPAAGGPATTLGTIVDPAGATQSMVGLAAYNGVLYGVKNIANEAVWIIDPATLIATVHIDYVDADYDFGGLAFDPLTGDLYATNDDTTPHGSGLFRINADATATLITPYPAGETDIDGLAVGDNGRAYLIEDESGPSIHIWDFAGGAYVDTLNTPWATAEVFSGGSWVPQGDFAAISLAKTVGTDPNVCAATDEITVPAGTEVTYCFEVTNSGTITLTLHDLDDSELGSILTGLAYSLAPGASAFVTDTATINATTVNTATWTAYNPGPIDVATASDTATVNIPPAAPNIDVDPLSMSSTQGPNTTTVQQLTIDNSGDADLDWAVAEEPLAVPPGPIAPPSSPDPASAAELAGAASPAPGPVSAPGNWRWPQAVLYDNGPLVTHPGGGAGGADASALQTAIGLNIYGFGHAVTSGFRVADDFTVPAGGWAISDIVFFAYQTGSTTASTINNVNLRIWDGVPGQAGSNIVFGDTTTNRLTGSVWTNSYRVLDTDLLGSTRPIMANTASVGTFLPAGTYWLDWQTGGTLASGPWAPPVSILGQVNKPGSNGLQYDPAAGTWNPLIDTGTAAAIQDLPFIINGLADCAAPSDIPWVSVNPTSGTTAPAGSSAVDVTFDSTGLAVGTYSGNLCVTSNDPDPGPGNGTNLVVVPVELTVADIPAISLAKTVGLDPAVCAPTDNIVVPAGGGGTVVYYCYEVTNTGTVTLTLHDLNDSELGNIFTALPYDLVPGASVDTVAAGLEISATITQTTVNTATWVAYAPNVPPVTASDSATVTRADPTGVALSGFGGDNLATAPLWLAGLLVLLLAGGALILRRKMAV